MTRRARASGAAGRALPGLPERLDLPEGVFLVLDVAACEGGATRGYQRAGAYVVAVDSDRNRLARNPADQRFVADGLEFIRRFGHLFHLIHESWPCQKFTRGNAANDTTHLLDLVTPGREVTLAVGVPYVIENVPDALPVLRDPIVLCGTMFGLRVPDADGLPLQLQRHRLFEANWSLIVPEGGACAPHACAGPEDVQWAGVYGGGRRARLREGEPEPTLAEWAPRDRHAARYERRGGYVPRSPRVQSALLGGVDWMTGRGRQESLPPAYTEWIGRQAIERLWRAVA